MSISNLSLDNCAHCACETGLARYTVESAIKALERKELGCWNCEEDQDRSGDGHTTCVQLLERVGDEKIVRWDGRCKKTPTGTGKEAQHGTSSIVS